MTCAVPSPDQPPALLPSASDGTPTGPNGTRPEAIRTGHCQCGRIAYQVAGDPIDPHLCSCRHETRISGGPAVLWVGFRKDTLAWTGPGGEPEWYATYPTLRRGFCDRCGTHLVSVADGENLIAVTGFSLTDRRGIAPVGHSFRDEAEPWANFTLAPDSGHV
ncbi:GFA family protein [Streptomyces sp. NPDC055103]